jgi:hypothetical protein
MSTKSIFNAAVIASTEPTGNPVAFHASRLASYDCIKFRQDGDRPCRRVTCNSCGRVIIYAWLAEFCRAARHPLLKTHVVLTVPPDLKRTRKNADSLRDKFKKLRRAYATEFNKTLSGIWVLADDYGRLHFHVLVNTEAEPWIKEYWTSQTGGYQVCQTAIYNLDGISGYLLINYASGHNLKIGRRIGAFGATKLNMSRAIHDASHFEKARVLSLKSEVESRMDAAHELPNRSGRRLWPYPPFRSAHKAARNLIDAFGAFNHWLVMPWPNLAPLRAELLKRNKTVIVPDRDGSVAMEMTGNGRGLVPTFKPYRGPVDAVVIACTAFDPAFVEPYAFDNDTQAALLENVMEPEIGLLPVHGGLIKLCLASDAQRVEHWPRLARGGIQTHLIFTSTQVIPLDPHLKEAVGQ